MKNLQHIITQCREDEPRAQKQLYDRYTGILFGICRRYIRDMASAEDVLQEVWYKIFTKINQYNDHGSFEGWMKRIAVNESLMYLRKSNNFNISLDVSHIEPTYDQGTVADISYREILSYLDLLPTGYRTVFNLYVVEGYKHREIAETLGISINTSKSQLILAKKRLKDILKKKDIKEVG